MLLKENREEHRRKSVEGGQRREGKECFYLSLRAWQRRECFAAYNVASQ
jgi:hypothetical protein